MQLKGVETSRCHHADMYCEIYETGFEERIRAPEASLLMLLWRIARENADIPDEHALPASRFSYLRSDMMILRPVIGQPDWIYEHYGSNISALSGFDMTGKRVSDFRGPTRDFYLTVYERVTTERRPLASVHRLGRFGETPLWERLILPVGTGTQVSGLYVVNKVREMASDISHLNARARDRALIVLQFQRDDDGEITDAVIVGANEKARIASGQRLDQLINRKALDVFPGIVGIGLWDCILRVGKNRAQEAIQVDYQADGIDGLFDLAITPMLDGVTVDFELLSRSSKSGRAA